MLELPLVHLHRPAEPASAEPWLLILLHGVGSDEANMFSLAPHVPPQFHVLSLRGPIALDTQSHAWFQVQFTPTGPLIHEAQEAASRVLLAEVVASAAMQLGIPAQRVVVGGFSQGGIMSLSLLLTQPQLMQAAMVMHSRLLEQVEPLIAAPERLEGRQVWVSQGLADQVMPPARGQYIRERLESLPVGLRYAEFASGHSITAAELDESMNWLREIAA